MGLGLGSGLGLELESHPNPNPNRNPNPHPHPRPNPKPNSKPHQVWGEAVTEEMVLDEQMLRGLTASEERGTMGPKELL